MATILEPDICVIGAGSGGLSVAAAAAQFGVDVVLVEKGQMGGDCLNYGCVPSKALIAAGKRAQAMREGAVYGVRGGEPLINPARVRDHVKGVIAAIEPNDSVERFTGLGVNVIAGEARFKDADTVEVDGTQIKARRFVVATGSSPSLPPVEGLDSVPHFTNETIFDNAEQLDHLIVLGGGPIGMELAQAHRRLGSEVTVLEAFTPLGKDDPELTRVVLQRLADEGVQILDGIRIERIEKDGKGVRAKIGANGQAQEVSGTHLLVAAGRKANVEGLDLEKAGIEFDRRGIKVSKGLKSTNKRVYAIGDVAGGLQFTHVANYHAGLVIRNALFRLPVKTSDDAIPWVTYTDPELANVGLSEEQARERHGQIRVLRWPLAENDRAQAERQIDGFVKAITTKRGRIVGAAIVGDHAGELIQTWGLAISQGLKVGAMAGVISPYPTLGEINKRAAITYYLPSLSSPLIRKAIGFLRKFG
jgi:pyruvate/2-oxoglutarate dehydrogenase complex dihydrolipoamide dehydrogenase (E3) component